MRTGFFVKAISFTICIVLTFGIAALNARGKVSSETGNEIESRSSEFKNEDVNKYISWGISCFKKGQMEDAVSELNKAINLDPEKDVAYFVRGSAYQRLDQLDNAISDYNKAIELNPSLAVAYQNRGSVYYIQGLFENAIPDYSKAIEINPGLAAAYQDRGNIYQNQGQPDKAISDYNKALELNGDLIFRGGVK